MSVGVKFIALIVIATTLFIYSIFKTSWFLIAVSIGLIAWIFWTSRTSRTSFNKVSNYVQFSDPKIESLRARLSVIIPEINNEDVKIYGSDKSFTINKKNIYLCIKDENGTYYEDNMLVYVLLHELAHVLCDEIDDDETQEHKPKFKRINQELLDRATAVGLFNPNIPLPDNYCGY